MAQPGCDRINRAPVPARRGNWAAAGSAHALLASLHAPSLVVVAGSRFEGNGQQPAGLGQPLASTATVACTAQGPDVPPQYTWRGGEQLPTGWAVDPAVGTPAPCSVLLSNTTFTV